MPDSATTAPATIDLAEVLATRLCHDLAGLCGTLQGALELLGDVPAEAPEALALSQEAARALSDRLRLIRAAWGVAAQPLGQAGLRELAAGLPGAPRVGLQVSGSADIEALGAQAEQVLLNALLLAAEALPGGGTIELAVDPRGFEVIPRGRRAAWPAHLPGLLHEPARLPGHLSGPGGMLAVLPEAGPRGLQAILFVRRARAAGALPRLCPLGEAEAPARLRVDWAPA